MVEEQHNLMNPEELADYLRVSLRTVYSYDQKGEIPAIKIVGQWRFDKRDIDAWVDSQRITPKVNKVQANENNEVTSCKEEIISGLSLSDIPIDIKMLFHKQFSKKSIDESVKQLKKTKVKSVRKNRSKDTEKIYKGKQFGS